MNNKWLRTTRIVTEPKSGEIDLEIPKEQLERYAEYGSRAMQIKLPSGCYIVNGWYPDDDRDRVNVRLARVTVEAA